MKLLTCLIALVVSGEALVMAAPPRNQELEDYFLGNGVGECFIVGCEIFHGFLLADSAMSGEPVPVRVETNWSGAPTAGTIVELPYEDLAHIRNGDGVRHLGDVWREVRIAKNVPVTVLLGTANGYSIHPGELVKVTSSPRESEIIRSLIDDALRLRASPDLVAEMVASLSRVPNSPLAGYLTAYLDYQLSRSQPELSSSLLLEMVRNSSIPSRRMESVVRGVVVSYYRLSDSGKASIVQRMAELGQQPDNNIARAGYTGLAEVGKFDRSIVSRIPPGTIEGLGNAYRAMVKKGNVPRNKELEAALGFKYEE